MIIKEKCRIEPLERETTLHIYLPDEYEFTTERYPVMIMLDGHNLFYDEDATYGKSWGLKTFLDSFDKKIIIVGIECDNRGRNRLSEYCPYSLDNSFLGPIEGKGEIFFDWVFGPLKDKIDRDYRTWPFREGYGIGGSSMGGLMALYAGIHYNRWVSKCACLSPSFLLCEKQLIDELKQTHINPDTRFYMSFGENEMGKDTEKSTFHLNKMKNALNAKVAQAMIQVIPNGNHNEASWEKENPTYFNYLWK